MTENIADATTQFCSLESIELNESLIGTAPRADVWFALEYPGRWGNKAFEESTIPDDVKQQVNSQLKLIPESKLVLIKQKSRPADGSIRFFAAVTGGEEEPALYRIELADYSDLLSLDLVSLAAQNLRYIAALSEEPLFLVCTNGLRDQCCTLHGAATYAALSAEFGDLVWESTHHGGHRFAANLAALPAGLSFGRLRAENANAIVRAALEGRIALEHFRGRYAYPEAAQAGEILLREKLGLDRVRDLTLIESKTGEDGRWLLSYAAANGKVENVVVERSEGPEQVHLSCGDTKTSPMVHFRLLEHKSA
jgi:hypothetical protein